MMVYKPEIAELLLLVEKKYDKVLRTTTDFDLFSLYLKREQNELISTSTLKRLWGYVNDLHQPRKQTLDVLARFLEFDNFDLFCEWLKKSPLYNSSYFTTKQILVSELQPGVQLEIGWSPNRYLLLVYKGNSSFEVLKSEKSKLSVGDCFEVSSFMLGQPLLLPYVLRNGERTSPFIAGRNGGLTMLNCL